VQAPEHERPVGFEGLEGPGRQRVVVGEPLAIDAFDTAPTVGVSFSVVMTGTASPFAVRVAL
jgi:hypothetical protein